MSLLGEDSNLHANRATAGRCSQRNYARVCPLGVVESRLLAPTLPTSRLASETISQPCTGPAAVEHPFRRVLACGPSGVAARSLARPRQTHPSFPDCHAQNRPLGQSSRPRRPDGLRRTVGCQ